MKGMGITRMTGEQRERWAEARRKMYRKVLHDPGASEDQKRIARKKIDSTRLRNSDGVGVPIPPHG